jgi:leukotriene-A4 hydrolase
MNCHSRETFSLLKMTISTCAFDPNSFANADQVKIIHSSLEWNVDMDQEIISGTVTHTVRGCTTQGSATLVLDSNNISIKAIRNGNGDNLEFYCSEPHSSFGTAITIKLNHILRDGQETIVGIDYQTGKGCSAIQFLSPEQTVGKQHKYLFSQCQPIHARSLMPCQVYAS